MPAEHLPTLNESVAEYGRGIAGGFLFSLPLLLTAEVWTAGATATPLRLLAGLGGTFALLCAYNTYAGLRHDTGPVEIAIDSVEELGLGLALGAGVLVLVGRIGPDTSTPVGLGMILVEGLAVAIGVSVGTAQLSRDSDDQGAPAGRHDTLESEVVLALCGAILVGANIAPTDEVRVLAVGTTPLQLLGVMIASLGTAALLMYHSNFAGAGRFAGSQPLDVLQGSAITYAVALLASAATLWFFGRLEGQDAMLSVSQTIVLGMPASLGAAVGRLLLR